MPCLAAGALGPERTREELLPFLVESVDDDDDVLRAMAEGLGESMVELVGGPEHAFALLAPLEQLATVEELSVRDRAVQSMSEAISTMPEDHIEENALPLLSRLAERDWFTSRIAAAGLVASIYPRAPDGARKRIVTLFQSLCTDTTPMVRRAAASHLAGFAAVLPADLVDTVALPLAGQLSTDEQDSVRLLAAESFAALAVLLPAASRSSSTLPPLKRLAKDSSWRVRWSSASQALAICQALRGQRPGRPTDAAGSAAPSAAGPAGAAAGSSATSSSSSSSASASSAAAAATATAAAGGAASHLPPLEPAPDADTGCVEVGMAFAELLGDSEAEVRAAAAARVSQVASQARDATVTDRVLERCRELASDSFEHVRAALAGSVLGMAGVLSDERCEADLLPIALELLRDTASQVRLSVIERLEEVNAVAGSKLLTETLLPAIVDLAKDAQWRVRRALLAFMPLLARQLGEATFSSRLTDICIEWLSDDVASVRDDAASNLRAVTDVFGFEWAGRSLVPRLKSLAADPSYLIRVTAVRAAARLGALAPAVPAAGAGASAASKAKGAASAASARAAFVPASAAHAALVDKELLPLVIALTKDAVPNVRFNVAKAVALLAPAATPEKRSGRIRDALAKMRDDKDADVRHFSGVALSELKD